VITKGSDGSGAGTLQIGSFTFGQMDIGITYRLNNVKEPAVGRNIVSATFSHDDGKDIKIDLNDTVILNYLSGLAEEAAEKGRLLDDDVCP